MYSTLILSVLIWKGDSYAPLSTIQTQTRIAGTHYHEGEIPSLRPRRTTILFVEKNKKDKEEDVGKLVSSAVNALKDVGVSILGDVMKDRDSRKDVNEKNFNETTVDTLSSLDEVDLAEQLRRQVDKEIALNELKTKLNEIKKAADDSGDKKSMALEELESLKIQSVEMKSKDEDLYQELQKEFR